MLRHTFIHLPGVGPRTEELLWQEGISTWEEALRHPLPFLGPWHRQRIWEGVGNSLYHLERGDASYFANLLPPKGGPKSEAPPFSL